jgi:hypothetical protein
MTVRDFALIVILSHHVACATPKMDEKPPHGPEYRARGKLF